LRSLSDPIEELRAIQRRYDLDAAHSAADRLVDALVDNDALRRQLDQVRTRAERAELDLRNAREINADHRRTIARLERNVEAARRAELVDDRHHNSLRSLMTAAPA
jgi:hypothetical protein